MGALWALDDQGGCLLSSDHGGHRHGRQCTVPRIGGAERAKKAGDGETHYLQDLRALYHRLEGL
jgi:hypothetical protein